ncbi:MAG: ribosomal L7Ae/L30e/S12e/Gadd45 family protein [Candidatus Aenigmarchaeota archaeon]|nr:ribosomal L7Ae/L30e/S12e/Gadd45 family protein [Candidatus Aenigmarchaeota archaeon]
MQNIPTTSKLPPGKAVIGIREVVKSIKAGKAKKVIAASNCPKTLVDKVNDSGKVIVEIFEGDSKDLGTKLGKPFPVSVAAFS